ncbi:uncharacterized protein LOC129921758 isoform X2 [Biomphalaria glabrata]|uniref:Uncharacterized protein LOC129921758 isoform X2 n=1 Tax=Biomphalaria glabrata TaxID=6526 RepID=A0A9W2YCZ1_BIOGL|nr:uncharacterized protein LOC129921758 isoform X2 [Biomphalaria glabrata]
MIYLICYKDIEIDLHTLGIVEKVYIMSYTLTICLLIALYRSVDSIDKRQSTRLETKCRKNKDYTYLRYRNTEECWKWGENYLNYTNAIRYCQEGALLGTIKTENERTLIWRFFKNRILWNGLDKINKPTFTWIDDNKPEKNFSYYFPDVPASQDLRALPDCSTLETLTDDKFHFFTKPCFVKFSYICEIR